MKILFYNIVEWGCRIPYQWFIYFVLELLNKRFNPLPILFAKDFLKKLQLTKAYLY